MSDHIDGPRSIGDPPTDVTDLFAFRSPENPDRCVFVANFFPFAGKSALFSNAADYNIVVRQVTQTGMGAQAGFKPVGSELRFTFQFDSLQSGVDGQAHAQQGICTLPDGRTLKLTANQEGGVATSDNTVRVFAGLRSDPFFVGWFRDGTWKPVNNLIEGDNILSIVLEVETAKILKPQNGTLFGAIAETTSRVNKNSSNLKFQRYDWAGRPEQTNFILFMPGKTDLSDLWNQQTPFALSEEFIPIFRQRLTESLRQWDLNDDKINWDAPALDAHVNIRLNDFLLIDIAKPTTDTSYLEIEKSAIEARPHVTGGGRTLNAKDIDILVTWLTNRDQGSFLQSPATQATKPAGTVFPYVQPPNVGITRITRQIDVQASPERVWVVVGNFGGLWHPLIANLSITGEGIEQLRRIETIDGKVFIERLQALDANNKVLTYTMISGLPADFYEGQISVEPNGTGSRIVWTVNFRHAGIAGLFLGLTISTLIDTGMAALQAKFASKQ